MQILHIMISIMNNKNIDAYKETGTFVPEHTTMKFIASDFKTANKCMFNNIKKKISIINGEFSSKNTKAF